ncbi:uncharacterized protein LOC133724448 isoform X3 [Rosa rugosa]|uniref:uncharacterized protein LOC133724448 isoform X3 n=1 Tax=Rosa rugosa TaxID=74645 RepID=UPI002B4129ED|nr:uncharacterized protein LOC133724448 isoform X3 [Rosa rugosa]
MSSFSPWIFTVDSASHDRTYSNSITLGTTSPFLELDLHGPLQKKMSKWLHVLMKYVLIFIFTQGSCNLKRLSSNADACLHIVSQRVDIIKISSFPFQ